MSNNINLPSIVILLSGGKSNSVQRFMRGPVYLQNHEEQVLGGNLFLLVPVILAVTKQLKMRGQKKSLFPLLSRFLFIRNIFMSHLDFCLNPGSGFGGFGFQNNNAGNKILDFFLSKVLAPVITSLIGIGIGVAFREITNVPTSKTGIIDLAKEDFRKLLPSYTYLNPEMRNVSMTETITMDNVFLLCDRFIRPGEVTCIFADAGIGKTLLALFIARKALPKKTVYFALDDRGTLQYSRYQSVSSMRCIDRTAFDLYLSSLRVAVADKIEQCVLIRGLLPDNARVADRRERLMKEVGIHDSRKIDELLLFEIMVESYGQNAEIVILDSLNSLVGYEFNINRKVIDRITRFCKEQGKTMIILHHTNKAGKIAGSSALKQMMDTTLRLDKIDGKHRKITVEKDRFQPEGEFCIVKMVSEGDHPVSFEPCEEPPQSFASELPPLDDAILKAIGDKEEITFADLSSLLKAAGFQNPNSIKNALKKLEDEGHVTKADGSSWAVIKNRQNEVPEDAPETGAIAPDGFSANFPLLSGSVAAIEDAVYSIEDNTAASSIQKV